MYRKYLISYILFVLGICMSFADNNSVGINTSIPVSTLDINGNIRVRSELLVGGNDSIPGSAGNVGEALLSQGEGFAVTWKKVDPYIPDFGDYKLRESIVNTSTKGLQFTYNQLYGGTPFTSNQYINNTGSNSFQSGLWKIFDELTIELPESTDPLKVVISFQVVAKSGYVGSTGNEGWNSFGIGVCIDDPNNKNRKILKAAKTASCIGIKNPQKLFSLFAVLDDIPASTTPIKLYIVATQRNTSLSAQREQAELVLGQDLNNSKVNQSFLKRASVRADIYEKIR